MANPTSPLNSNSKDLDVLVATTGTSALKRAVGLVAAAGITDSVADQAVATDVDDAAFRGAGTATIVVAGALADETATDSVDEGDVGALRMTLNRRLITAGNFLDDSAFGIATDYIGAMGALADETATDSVTEGDVGAVRMTLDRRQIVASQDLVDAAAGAADRVWPVGVVRDDALTTLTPADGDYAHLRVDSMGALWTRGSVDATILTSAARTASTDSTDQTNHGGRGVHVVIDATASADTPSIVVTIQGKDVASGKYYTVLASAAITGVSTTVLRVYPGLVAVANQTIADVLPRTWRVSVVAADADSLTYSVGASIIP